MKKKHWKSVKDHLPPEVTPVLVYGECCDICYHILVAEIEDGEWFQSGTGDDLVFKPTHWMNIPEPPI